MAGRQIANEARAEPGGPELAGAGPIAEPDSGESKIRSDEIYRMAAFRIRETANRIATLANSAREPTLRNELLAVCQKLLEQERALLSLDDR